MEYLDDLYKEKCTSDLYFSYYNAEFDINADIGLERTDSLEHRFDSWRISQRLKK